MNDDTLVVGSIIAIALSIFPLLNGISRGEMPRSWAVLAIAGFGLLAVIVGQNPGAYTADRMPEVFARVFSNFG